MSAELPVLSPDLPVLTRALIERFEALYTDFTIARMDGIRRQEGNPLDVEFGRFGQAVALRAAGVPLPEYNQVLGMGPADEAYIEEILAFYQPQRINFSIEFVPGCLNESLGRYWAAAGFAHTGFHAILYGLPGSEALPVPGVEIRQVTEAADFETFLEINCEAMEVQQEYTAAVKKNIAHWFGTPGWQLYLAYCGQTPAAAAVLYIQDDLAYLAAAATVPAQRRKGCQQALLAHRLQAAALADCRLVTGRCEPYSTSQHNMERAGLRLAAVSAIWTRASHSSL